MTRKLFLFLLAVAALAGCSSDPVPHGMTTQQQATYSKAIAGVYTGTYTIVYNDGGSDKKVKIANAQMTITDETSHAVCFHDFPVSLLAKVVNDDALAEALQHAPNMDLVATYRFYDLQDNGDVNWGYVMAAVPLTLHYGGADHHLVLKLHSGAYFGLTKARLDAGTPFPQQSIFQFEVVAIYESNTLVEDLDAVWQNNNMFLTLFQLGE